MAKANVESLEVNISLLQINKNQRRLKYDNPTIEVKRGTKIKWNCENNFTIYFGWNSPFEEIQYHGNGKKPVVVTVPNDAIYDKYKYYVAVEANGTIIIDDPDVIIIRGKRSGE